VIMASYAPERAQSYLRGVLKRDYPEDTIRDIIRFRGTLAKAAPAELVELTVAGLLLTTERNDRVRHQPFRNKNFTDLDDDFLPPSPAQGPFLDLLEAAPEQGVCLIRRVVEHALPTLNKERGPIDDGFTVVFPSGPRLFLCERSYCWSRDAEGCYSVESALLALEAWSHARLERGDAPDQVIVDILGPEGSPAAFVLVAVDVLISHWPKTMAAAVPFLGSPKLLWLDRIRQAYDLNPEKDFLRWGEIRRKESIGPPGLGDLRQRPSRRISLEFLLGDFAKDDGVDAGGLRCLLETASTQLGSPEANDTFAEPRFMARYALNLTDPGNWYSRDRGLTYISPADEARHLADLQAKSIPQTKDFGIEAAVQNRLEARAQSVPELVEHAVAYAKRLEVTANTPEDARSSRANTVVAAALLVVRDGAEQLFEAHEDWVRAVFTNAFEASGRQVGIWLLHGIRFNPVGIATLGAIHLWRRRGRDADRDVLLELAGRDTAAAAQGFGAGLDVIRETDRRLLAAILRCALTAQVQPTRDSEKPEDQRTSDQARYRERVAAAITAERGWLGGDGQEPPWPSFPPLNINLMRGLRIDGDETDEAPGFPDPAENQLYSANAAWWVRQMAGNFHPCDLAPIRFT